jgi:hypothetical protein
MEPVVAPDGRQVIFAVRDQPPDAADPSPSDRLASFGSRRRGGDIWVMDGI